MLSHLKIKFPLADVRNQHWGSCGAISEALPTPTFKPPTLRLWVARSDLCGTINNIIIIYSSLQYLLEVEYRPFGSKQAQNTPETNLGIHEKLDPVRWGAAPPVTSIECDQCLLDREKVLLVQLEGVRTSIIKYFCVHTWGQMDKT